MHLFIRTLIIFIFSTSVAQAETPKLYKSYGFGAPLSEFPVGAQYYDCTIEQGVTARCNDNESFLNHEFELILKFDNDRLESVMLATVFDQQIYAKTIGALNNDFSLIMLQSQTDQLDIINLLHQSKNREAFQARVAEYESINLSQGQLTYIFIEQSKEAYQKNKTATQAVMNAPKSVRTAELIVFDADEDAVLGLEFYLPALQIEKMNQAIKAAPKEAF